MFESRWIDILRKVDLIGFKAVRKVKDVSFAKMYCPSGEFWMGADHNCRPRYDDTPRHYVEMSKALIGQTHVTEALWNAVMGDDPNDSVDEQLPVLANWFDALRFCNSLSELEGLTPA